MIVYIRLQFILSMHLY